MKIVALIPFRNESLLLPACLTSLRGIADDLVGYDDGSTDDSKAIFESFGGTVLCSAGPGSSWAAGKERDVRCRLLTEGRQRKGTHFIWLDADEAFSANFKDHALRSIVALAPGHKLALQWLALWKTSDAYRDDKSVWSNNYKDFIVHDAPELGYNEGILHFGRTQGPNTPDNWHTVPLEQGAVLHFQFAAWRQFQAKQCWYRCAELRQHPDQAEAINERYAITLDDPTAKTTPIPSEWVAGLPVPRHLNELPPAWHLQEIFGMFEQHGAEFFEALDIWHVPELHTEFMRLTGKHPKIHRQKDSLFSRAIRKVKKNFKCS